MGYRYTRLQPLAYHELYTQLPIITKRSVLHTTIHRAAYPHELIERLSMTFVFPVKDKNSSLVVCGLAFVRGNE